MGYEHIFMGVREYHVREGVAVQSINGWPICTMAPFVMCIQLPRFVDPIRR